MSELYPLVDVVVLLIGRDGRLLLDYNEPWSAFCFPITKIRDLPAKVQDGQGSRESPQDAAVRAAAEVLGVPLPVDRLPQPVDVNIQPYQQSSRDGEWKRYKFHLFSLKIAFDPKPLPGHTATWLKPNELKTHHPMSPTMYRLIDALDTATLAKLPA